MLKTIGCGKIRNENAGQIVQLAGWVNRRRDHGNLIFIDLRDRYGIVQVVFNPELAPGIHSVAESLRSEWVVKVEGRVATRPDGSENPNLPTGGIEVFANELEVLNESKTPPFELNDENEVDELLRLQYRYLDLRREQMRDVLILRHRVVKFIRDFLDEREFLEVETPILIKSTPEGARDYLVPSRLYPGKFYALPQSPQQLKQLLMASGVEKYFQIARCFRDEDPRADRQPEHTQLDLEMSFVDQDDVLNLIEELYTALVKAECSGKKIISPFPKLTYAEAMEKYASDKPDLRFGLEMSDVSDIAAETKFRIFTDSISNGGIVKGFVIPDGGNYSRKLLDELVAFVKERGAKGLLWIAFDGDSRELSDITTDQVKSPIARHASLEQIRSFGQRLGAGGKDLILMVAGPSKSTNVALSALRNEMATRLDLADPNLLAFAFVIDFPLFEWNDDESRWDAAHHAFSMPKAGYEKYVEDDPGKVIGNIYDLVCNGLELASGSIRVHKRALQEQILKVLGYNQEQIKDRFGQLLDAFDYGTPPHGGIAPGIERLLMTITGIDNIRDVIAFPKTQSGIDPLFDSPNAIEQEQLDELNIKFTLDR